MALEVAEGAVVRHHLEAVAERLEAAAGAVAPVAAVAHEVGEHRRPLVRRQVVERGPRLVLRHRGGLEQQRGQQLFLAPLDVEQPHRRAGLLAAAGAVEPQARCPAVRRLLALVEVGDPLAAAVGTVHTRHEARHHRLQLGEDHPGVLARLGERRRRQPEQ